MSLHAHKPYLHTRQRKSSILNSVALSTTATGGSGEPLSKHPGLHVSNSRVSGTRAPHSRLLNLTLPFLNFPGSRIRKASPTVSLTHVNAAAASCINIDIINIDHQCLKTQPQYKHHDHYLPSITAYDCQSQNINIIPFPSSCPASSTVADRVSVAHRNVDVDVKTPSAHEQPPPYCHRRTPRRALTVSNSNPKPKSGGKTLSRRSKAKHVRAYAGSLPSASASRKSHKRLAADIQFLETVYRSVASHRAERPRRAGGDGETDGDKDALMDAQECLLLQHLSDLMIELGHRVPALSCKSPSPVPSPEAGQETDDETGVELTSPDDPPPPSPPIPLPAPRSPPPPPLSTPLVRTPAFPARPPGLSLLTRIPRPAILPIVPPPLSSPPLPTISLSPPVLSMPQIVAGLTLRRRERGGGADARGRRLEWAEVREGRKSGLGAEVRVDS